MRRPGWLFAAIVAVELAASYVLFGLSGYYYPDNPTSWMAWVAGLLLISAVLTAIRGVVLVRETRRARRPQR